MWRRRSLKPYLFNGKELDTETGLYYYGARYYDPRISIWISVDPLAEKYPDISPYTYVANNPINAIDPDGRYIIFIGGLRLGKGNADQQRSMGGFKIHKTDVYNYWSTDKNTFGRSADIASYYQNKYNDNNVGFTSGSSHWNSSAEQRMGEGKLKAELFHKMVQDGDIKLTAGETIKVISHSQGGAHAAGYAEQLMSYKDSNGNPLYNVEVIEYITPHQPKDITHPSGSLGIQYSHPGDPVASDSPWWLPNGGTEYGKIKGIDKFFGGDIMGGKGQPPCGGAGGNRCGHNVTDNDQFIKKGE
ncbi:RHS repeat-associated core domain-containing protein [Candidatus Ornithobacterium hominis]|uniref:RHS repeat-associated core domain-containing protein n=1 Tax=Candidatus Ornithobacterium hominis TaxID=2497989 RepID=UPI0024BC3BB6|nr:RHS repeat-associated core domain-containing protein [Candidatus Ornithobacterium hominis]CAI9430306.1 RHS repeat-associated core domain-containing protein [Candidatus Ornithobacterium hominis]